MKEVRIRVHRAVFFGRTERNELGSDRPSRFSELRCGEERRLVSPLSKGERDSKQRIHVSR